MSIEFEEQVRLLFPTPLLETKVEVTQELLEFVDGLTYKRTPSGDGFMSADCNILDSPEISHIKQEVDKKVKIYFHGICKYNYNAEPELSSSWAIVHHHKDHAQAHLHANSIISGIWYLKTPKNCGNISFMRDVMTPFGNTLMFDQMECNNINSFDCEVEPKKDMMYIFPSILRHRVYSNQTKSPRIALAFNYFVRGEIRSEDHYIRI